MASTIRIKRSSVSGNPGTLAAGELAYSALPDTGSNGGDRLYIGIGAETGGNAANHFVIGGKFFTDMLDHTPGVLTTSSAIITDASNKISQLLVDNLELNGNTITTTDSGNLILTAGGSATINFYSAYSFPRTAGTAGQALVSDGAGNLTWAGVTTANTATNLAGGTAGQIPYQSAPGTTGFFGPGTAGQLLVSNGNSAPVYTSTGSIYVSRAVLADTATTATSAATAYALANTGTTYVGRAALADAWTSARTITLGGDLTGSVQIDGSGNATLTATIATNSVALGTDTTGDYVSNGATSGFGLSGSTTGESQTFTVTANSTSSNTISTIVYRDGSGNFSAGAVTLGSTQASSTTTGALIVTGGAGIGGNLYVGGEIVAQKLTIQYTTVTTTLLVTDDVIQTTNSTASSSTTTGALVVAGGAGIGGNLNVGGIITAAGGITGSITTATNLAGGTAGQLAYQTAAGVTSFAGPGTAGQLLVSNSTSGPQYTNTGSIYVGNAVNADKWSTARTVTFTGDTTGTFTIDGSANVSNVALTIAANSVALGTDTTGDYVSTGATSGFGLSGSTTGESQTFTVTANSTSSNTLNSIVYRNGSGDFAAGVISASFTGNLTGTASTATNLAGGAANQIPYQTAAGVSAFLSAGTYGQVLQVVNTSTGAFAWGDIDGGTY